MWPTLLRRALLIVGAAMALTLMLVGAAHLPIVRARVLDWARARASNDFGIAVDAGALDYNLFTLTAVIEEIRLSAPGERPFLEADRARVTIDWRVLVGRAPEITRLDLTGARVTFVRRADGRTNLPSTRDASVSPPTPVHAGLVSIAGLHLDVEDEAGGYRGTAGPLDLTLDTTAAHAGPGQFGPGPFAVTIDATDRAARRSIAGTFAGRLGFDGTRLTASEWHVDAPEVRLTVDGWIDVLADTVAVDLRGQVDTDLARAGPLAGDAGRLLAGSATAQVAISGLLGDPSVRLVASGHGLRYDGGPAVDVEAEAAYHAGRLDIGRVEATSALGAAEASGSLTFAAGSRPNAGRVRARIARLDVDRIANAAGVSIPLPLGSAAEADLDVAFDGPNPLGADWWQQLNGTGAVRLSPTDAGLAVDGRLDLRLERDRWSISHTLKSARGRTTLDGVLAGQTRRAAYGTIDSTLSGRTRVRADELRALTPFVQQAGVALPAPLGELDGSIDAVVDPRGTLARPSALATIAGRHIRIPDRPDGALDSTVVATRRSLTATSLVARIGPTTIDASGEYRWSGRFEGRFDVVTSDLGAAVRLADPAGLSVTGSARLAGTLSGTARSPGGQAVLTIRDLSAYEVAVGSVDADVQLSHQGVEIDARAPAIGARLQATLGLREPFPYDADLTLDRSSIPALLPTSLVAQIPASGTISAHVRSRGTVRTPLESAVEVALGSLDATLSGVSVRLDAPATMSIEPDGLTATPMRLQVGKDTAIRLQGTLGLDEVRGGLDVTLRGPLSDLIEAAALAFPTVRLEADRARVSADIHVGGTLRAPAPVGTVTLDANSLRYADQPPLTEVAVDARVDRGAIAVRSLTARWLGATLSAEGLLPLRMIVPARRAAAGSNGLEAWGSRWLASLPAEPRVATLAARLTEMTAEVLAAFVDPSTLPALTGAVDATLNAQAGALALEHVRGSLVLDRASLVLAGVPFAQTVPTRVAIERGRATIDELRWSADGNEVRVSGDADLLAPDRTVDLAIDGALDLRLIGAFATGVSGGGAARPALTVKGPIAAPAVAGSIGVEAGELRLDSPAFAASDVEGAVRIGADRVATLSLTGTVNGGTAAVEGRVVLADLAAPTGRMTLSARNVTLDYPEGFQTESNADLVLALEPSSRLLSGRVDVLSGLYREPIVVSRSLMAGLGAGLPAIDGDPSSFLSTIGLDIALVTAEDVRVDNNYGRLNLTADLNVTGTASQPGAIGRVQTEPGGEIYLAGNTYRVQSLIVDLENPRAIAPDVTFLADTRVGSVPIEVALQCTAAGTCEREVRSQAAGVTNEQAEALLFGMADDQSAAGAQLARLLSGELLGIVGHTVGLDVLRLEQGTTREDLFANPVLVAGDVNPASRLTFGKRLGNRVELAYSQNLAEAGFTTSTQYFAPGGVSLRALLLDNQSRTFEFRHEPRFGAARRPRSVTAAPAIVSAVRFAGTPGFGERELRGRLRVKEGDRFAFAAWQADRERLSAFYRDRGFFEARVRARREIEAPPAAAPGPGSPGGDRVVLEYTIERGLPTRLEVAGHALPDTVRRRIVARWGSTIVEGFLERDAALIVREHLYGVGLLHARVKATIERSPAGDGKTLHVLIDPGPVTTPRLEFEGNAIVSTPALLGFAERAGRTAAWLDPSSFARLIERFHREEGLLSAAVRVQPPERRADASVVRVVIREGDPWRIGRVSVQGTVAATGAGLADSPGVTTGDRYAPRALADGVARLEQRYRDAGYLGAHVTAQPSLDAPARRVNLQVIVEPGARTVLESVAVEGKRDDTTAIADRARLETGAPLGAAAIGDARRRLYETGAYRSVGIDLEPVAGTVSRAGAPSTAGDRPVVARIRVEERPRYMFRYGLAFNDRFVGPDQRDRGIGFAADLENRNLLGSGATVGVSARIRRDQEVGRVYLGAPRFFGLPLRSNVFFSRGRQDIGSGDTFKTVSDVTEVSAEQIYRLRRFVDVRYGYGLGRNRTTLEGSDFDLTVRVARLTTSALVDRRNDPFDPARGWFSAANLELSRPGLGSDISFVRSFFQQFGFFPIRDGVVAAAAGRLGVARTFRDETLIPSERFFAGGGTSVRGYGDDTLGARSIFGDAEGGAVLFIANGELRFPIYRWVRGVGFVDLGNVYQASRDVLRSRVQAGAGGGIRISTPAGLLRFDIGAPLNPRPADSAWSLHVGLGHAF